MGESINILFTSIGRRVELVQEFVKAGEELNINVKIFGVDVTSTAPALFFSDEKRLICPISDSNYIPELLSVCRNDRIDILIPTIDTDLLALAKAKTDFEKIGTKVLVSESDKICICHDKRYTAEFFALCNLRSPIPIDDVEKYQQGYPCFIKPSNGSSSVNTFVINTPEELHFYAKKISNYIIQPFIEGTEYTVDIMCDFNGNPIYITPRERMNVRSGEVLKTRIFNDEKIITECKNLINKFKPCGPLTVQLIRQKQTNDDYYIEINPRFGGGSPLTMKAGANSAEALLRLIKGQSVTNADVSTVKNGLIYSRFDQCVCVNDASNEIVEITNIVELQYLDKGIEAIIFDLDDTLYSEKDYVRNGFQAVADRLSQVEDVYEKLWASFLKGKPAIDEVLHESNIYSDKLKKECVEAYRFHKPSLQLYPEIKNILVDLRKKGIKIGIITDGRPEGQHAKIEALDLNDLVDEIIITDELGGVQFRKPNDISFRLMQGKMCIPYGKMIYVGDNIYKDFISPARLGMRCCHFKNPDGLYFE